MFTNSRLLHRTSLCTYSPNTCWHHSHPVPELRTQMWSLVVPAWSGAGGGWPMISNNTNVGAEPGGAAFFPYSMTLAIFLFCTPARHKTSLSGSLPFTTSPEPQESVVLQPTGARKIDATPKNYSAETIKRWATNFSRCSSLAVSDRYQLGKGTSMMVRTMDATAAADTGAPVPRTSPSRLSPRFGSSGLDQFQLPAAENATSGFATPASGLPPDFLLSKFVRPWIFPS